MEEQVETAHFERLEKRLKKKKEKKRPRTEWVSFISRGANRQSAMHSLSWRVRRTHRTELLA